MWRDANGRPRLMTQDEGETLARHIFTLVDEPWVDVRLGSWVDANTAFARGDAHVVKEGGGNYVQIILRGCTVGTTRLDDEGLALAIAQGKEAAAQLNLREAAWELREPLTLGERPQTFFDETLPAMASPARAAIFTRALDATEAGDLIGAGDLNFRLHAGLTLNTKGLGIYQRGTYGEFSLTARTKDGRGSGWGWSGFEDWKRVDIDGVIRRATDLAHRSANPVAVEPGRYTVILEPTATAALVTGIDWSALFADMGATPFSKKPRGTNKIGLQMLDQRLDVVGDPWDPDLPMDTVNQEGDPVKRTVWFQNGVLRELWYDKTYGAEKGRGPTNGSYNRHRWSMKGPTQTLEEMIASTKRGVWVNRLSGTVGMNGRTHLMTGTTRDGTFLIEDGKITKAIKNFRFTESPFFVLNKLEAFGVPERAAANTVAPRVKVRDFDFTSLTDAV